MKRRTLLQLTVAAIPASLALTACSDDDGGSSDGTTTITLLSWTGEELMTQVIDAFHEAQPDVRIEASYSPPVNEYIQTLQNQVLSGTAPDMFLIAAENKTNLIDAGSVVDLAGQPFMANLPEFNRATYGRDGAEYGMSFSSWGAGYIYNTALLAEVGYDAVPTTWDDFLQMCHVLQDAGYTPFLEAADGIPLTVSSWLGSKSAAMGGTMDTQIFDGTSSFEEQWTPELEQYMRLFDEGLMTTDVVGLTGDQVVDEFTTGRVAVFPAGPWNIAGVREAAPDIDFMFTLIPGIDGREPYAPGAASPGYAINVKSDEAKQNAVKTFLTWIGSPEGTEIYQGITGDVTVTSDFEPVVDPSFEPIVPSIREGALYLPMISWTRSEDVLNVEAIAQIQRMISGEITPSEVGAAMDAKLASS